MARTLLGAALALAWIAAPALAQSPITDRTGFQVLVAEFGLNGSLGAHAQTEGLGGLAVAEEHLFGVDVTGLRRWGSGIAVGVRGGVYRYDPVGLGYRGGLVLGYARTLGPATLRMETEAAYLDGRFEGAETSYEASAVGADATLLAQVRVPLVGTVDLRPAVGPYVALTSTLDVRSRDDGLENAALEAFAVQGGAQVGAALTFALLDARVAVAPVTRFALFETEDGAAFSALPGGGIWVDF